MKKIYLAGKVAWKDWRHILVPGLEDVGAGGLGRWPVLPCEGFSYTGPYFASMGHSITHGPNQHGVLEDYGSAATVESELSERRPLVENCFRAISASDAVFVWLDDPTAYGTLVEVGFAVAHKKPIILASPEPISLPGCTCGHHTVARECDEGYLGDLWFAAACATQWVHAMSPVIAFNRWLASVTPKPDPALALLESPIERSFWEQHKALKLPALEGLVPQHKVMGGKYRLDFAIPEQRVAIELDGYEYHSSKDAFVNDRARQRALEAAGWRVIRFAGSEVHSNAAECVRQAAALVKR